MKREIKVRLTESGEFAAALVIGGAVVATATGASKREARAELRMTAEEMGLYTDGIGWAR